MIRLLSLLALLLLITACSAPAFEVIEARGVGTFRATLEGEPVEVDLSVEGPDQLCTRYRVQLGGAEAEGLAPGSATECEEPEAHADWTWGEVVAPVITIALRWLLRVT
jgi:hypothetical protein